MNEYARASIVPLRLIALMWLVFFIENTFRTSFAGFGILPRSFFGLAGVIAAPLLHGNFYHLLSNTIPLLILGTILFVFYRRVAVQVFFYGYLITNLLVWLFARPFLHIGASGLLYGIAAFLMTIGFFKKDFRSVAISLGVAFFYSSIIWGILPLQPGVSWESHVAGAIVGVGCASAFSKVPMY